ncbi:MAG: prepilin-type N-terminal cleavage/methylation domain-containing protein [Armatimonadetes bacterium]|nr:prepilin-type N-terminal cleavage/methylation domain-containing protein [Armatimonadota bacterium]
MARRKGFTLIELITVLAITAILMAIIFIPVVQGFNLTRAAQGFADAQDKARSLIARLERELQNAAAVRDNSASRGACTVVVPGKDGTAVATDLPFTKLDAYKPSEGDPTRGPSGAFINPDTGKEDPTLQAPKGQPNFPAASGMSMTRYFVGLHSPVSTGAGGQPVAPGVYNNPYDGLLMSLNASRDNLYVLYRAEVQVKVWRNGQYVVNTDLFQDANNDGQADDIDDPAFFTLLPGVDANYANGSLTAQGQAKGLRILNWLKKARVVTEVSRYDMVQAVYDRRTRAVYYVNNVPQLVPLVRFQPTRVTSEPAAGTTAVRTGEETNNALKVGPETFTTQYGAWSSLLTRTWPSIWPATFAANGARAGDQRARWGSDPNDPTPAYIVGRTWNNGGADVFSLFYYDPATMADDMNDGLEIFNVTRCLDIRRLPRPDVNAGGYVYPFAFTDSVNAATLNGNVGARLNFVPAVPDTRNGKLLSSFDSREVGTDQTLPYEYRVPSWGQQSAAGQPFDLRTGVRVSPYNGGAAQDYTPNNDPDVGTGVWTDPIFQPVNRRFNKLWNDFPTLLPGLDRAQYVKRFIDLRVCPQPDGTPSVLDPASGIGRAFVTPGSETVIGPDQRPGPNFGRYVRYSRVSQRPVGPNQYLINYVDQPEPDYSLVFAGQSIIGNPYDPLTPVPQTPVQALIQPQFRAGYVELNSRFGEPIPSGYSDSSGFHPTGNIFVTYRFQYTEPNDVIAVDYDSTQVMEVSLTIRNYPQTQNLPNPPSITVKGSAAVRNFVR